MQSFLGGNEMLRIENLTKSYGDKVAVDNLSLHIMPGGNLWLHWS
jgi:ABC-2 type transport system ATP-binding protein